jgi:hypothetical protein
MRSGIFYTGSHVPERCMSVANQSQALLPGTPSPKTSPVIRTILLILISLAVEGCAMAPSISVLGSYFPDWLFCAIAGLLLTLTVRGLLVRYEREYVLAPAPVVLPALTLLFSLLAWLIFF